MSCEARKQVRQEWWNYGWLEWHTFVGHESQTVVHELDASIAGLVSSDGAVDLVDHTVALFRIALVLRLWLCGWCW